MLRIPREIFKEIVEHGEKEAPLEACGYLTGRSAFVEGNIIMTNIDRSPDHFSFDPREQFTAVKTARANGQELVAVWHTHPASPTSISPVYFMSILCNCTSPLVVR